MTNRYMITTADGGIITLDGFVIGVLLTITDCHGEIKAKGFITTDEELKNVCRAINISYDVTKALVGQFLS